MKKRGLNSTHMEGFLTLMLSRNMAEAAEKLGVTEAAVSKTKKFLETELQVELFERRNGRLQPTAAAQRLLPYVQRATGYLQTAKEVAYRLRGDSTDHLLIAAGGPAAVSVVPTAVRMLHEEAPQFRIDVEIESVRRIIEMVAHNMADIGIGPPPTQEIDGRTLDMCNIRNLCLVPLIAAVPSDHPLAKQAVIRPADLKNETVISLTSVSATHEMVNAVFYQARIEPRSTINVANGVGICALVSQGAGIGLCSPLMLSGGLFPKVVMKPFRPRIELRTCIYESRLHKPSPLITRFGELLRTAATIAAGE